MANIGASQLLTSKESEIEKIFDSIQANLLAIHLNPLQESFQPEGTPQFRGVLEKISSLSEKFPVLVKETGSGMSIPTLRQLSETNIQVIDVSGLGGTHWGRIEGARADTLERRGEILARAAETFANWGVPTLRSTLNAVEWFKGAEIWASGGVRSGLDAAKLIAVGAHRVGFAQPALRSALEGEDCLSKWMERIEFEMRVSLFCTASAESPCTPRGGE